MIPLHARIQQLTQWVKAQVAAIASRFKRKPLAVLPAQPATVTMPPVKPTLGPRPSPKAEPPASPPPPPASPPHPKPRIPDEEMGTPINRAERRRLEHLRRRHDKFVTPKGPKPTKNKREPTPPQPTPSPKPEVPDEAAASNVTSGNIVIFDKHHEDREGEDVLYEETEMHGVFNFRDTILQQLERYFVYIERMKRRDPDSYEFYRQVGATVVPYLANNAHNRWHERDEDEPLKPQKELPAWFRQVRPAFGCFVYGADPESEKYEMQKHADKDGVKRIWWIPKFMYFTKYKKPPPTMQSMSGGDIYRMTIWWDRPFDPKVKRKHGVPNDFGIFVSADGKEIVALRMIDTKYTRIYSKKKHEEFWVPQRLWHIPCEYEEWAKQHGKDAQRMLTDIFIESIERLYLAQGSMVRVAATKNEATAVFGVNVDRMAYFFQDRDINLTEDGHRKHVFHMVRPHIRKDGTPIKFHFRGEREFTWAGYDILITVPGRDHYILDEMNIGAIDSYWIEKKTGNINMKEFGKRLDQDIRKGTGGYRPH